MIEELEFSSTPEEFELEKEAVAFFEAMDDAVTSGKAEVRRQYGDVTLEIGARPLGEGDRSLVFPLQSFSADTPGRKGKLCVKIAKQQPICRQRLTEEAVTTAVFLEENVPVPRILFLDPKGRFAVKEFIEGESITSLYMRFDTLPVQTQGAVLRGLEDFLNQLLDVFRRRPDCKVSISPNNIYLLMEDGKIRTPEQFVLVDPGLTPKKNYDGFNFDKYWNDVLPERIRKYQRTGYLQWLVPRQVTQLERDEAREFEIFRELKPAEIFLLLKIAKTIEFDAQETILKEGTIGENFYLILEGKVALRKGHYTKPGSWEIRLGSGSVLGEMGFLLRVPRSMTAVAATPCKLIEISRDEFQKLLDSNMTAPYKLLRNIAIILAERLYKLDQAHQKLLESDNQDNTQTQQV